MQHDEDSACSKMKNMIMLLDICKDMKGIMAQNMSDKVIGMRHIREKLHIVFPGVFKDPNRFLVGCISRVINLTVKKGMAEVPTEIEKF